MIDQTERMRRASEKREVVLPKAWAERLDLAAIAHDVGYVHGGRFHPSNGAIDMMENFGAYAHHQGLLPPNTPEQQTEIEKIAILAQMHGMSFPWDRFDARLPGDHHVSLDLVEELVEAGGGAQKLRAILRDEYRDYSQRPGALAWLDDPQEMKYLIRAGWLLHCADKNLGPKGEASLAVVRKAVSAGTVSGKLGKNIPLETAEQLDRHLGRPDPVVHSSLSPANSR